MRRSTSLISAVDPPERSSLLRISISASMRAVICRSIDACTVQYTKKPRTTAEVASSAAYRRASPKLAVPINLRGSSKDISDSPDGVDQLLLAPGAHLRPQPADMGFDDLGLRVEMKFPHPLEQHRPRHHTPGIAHEIFE